MSIPLLGGLQEIFRGRPGGNRDNFSTLEDFAYRLNCFYPVAIITILTTITMTSVYFLPPITCTFPDYPNIPSFYDYVESVCWAEGTIDLRKAFDQWVPFYLEIQAILFSLPHLFWQSLTVNALDDDFGALIARAKAANTSEDAKMRAKLVRACADQLFPVSCQHSGLHRGKSLITRFQRFLINYIPGAHLFVFSKRLSNRTAFYYLLVKLVYVVNCVRQIFLIMRFSVPAKRLAPIWFTSRFHSSASL
ncbi:hypothetical protein ACTXT7_011416 [Hymenolepis weldensis]